MSESYGTLCVRLERWYKRSVHILQAIYVLCLTFSDFLFKFLVIGSAGSGKSCLLHQFIESKCKYMLL